MHQVLSQARVVNPVSLDQTLVDASTGMDRSVVLAGEQNLETPDLGIDEQAGSGVQGAPGRWSRSLLRPRRPVARLWIGQWHSSSRPLRSSPTWTTEGARAGPAMAQCPSADINAPAVEAPNTDRWNPGFLLRLGRQYSGDVSIVDTSARFRLQEQGGARLPDGG